MREVVVAKLLWTNIATFWISPDWANFINGIVRRTYKKLRQFFKTSFIRWNWGLRSKSALNKHGAIFRIVPDQTNLTNNYIITDQRTLQQQQQHFFKTSFIIKQFCLLNNHCFIKVKLSTWPNVSAAIKWCLFLLQYLQNKIEDITLHTAALTPLNLDQSILFSKGWATWGSISSKR